MSQERQKPSAPGEAERRAAKRLFCSELVEIEWVGCRGEERREVAVLENLSARGANLFTGVPLDVGTTLRIHAEHAMFPGTVRHCVFRENGYLAGIQLEEEHAGRPPAGNYIPSHVLDPDRLDFE